MRDVEVLVYDYDSLNVETTILPAGSFLRWNDFFAAAADGTRTAECLGVTSPLGFDVREKLEI